MRYLKIESLPTERDCWTDRDQIMLHACFQILKDFVDKEDGLNEGDGKFRKEVRALYDWWSKRSDEDWTHDQHIEDDAMLARLMKIRTRLWT